MLGSLEKGGSSLTSLLLPLVLAKWGEQNEMTECFFLLSLLVSLPLMVICFTRRKARRTRIVWTLMLVIYHDSSDLVVIVQTVVLLVVLQLVLMYTVSDILVVMFAD